MDHKKLESELVKALEEFRANVEFNYETGDQAVTKDDLRELAKQTFYVLDQFKAVIVAAAKESK